MAGPRIRDLIELGSDVNKVRRGVGDAKKAIAEEKRLERERNAEALKNGEQAGDAPGGADKQSLTPEQIKNAESGTGAGFKELPEYKAWYRAGKKAAKSSIKERAFRGIKKQKKALVITLVINVALAGGLFLLSFISPLKNVHFETVLHTANYARTHLMARKQFSRVIFEASVLTRDSVGTYRESPLVKQIQFATPDRQTRQLGASGRLKWEFRENSSFGQNVLPLRETLKAVVFGEGTRNEVRVDIDEISRDLFGADYEQLGRGERLTVGSEFVKRIEAKMADIMKLLPRHVRWNPMYQLRKFTRSSLSRWINNAKDWAGEDPDERGERQMRESATQVSGGVELDPSRVESLPSELREPVLEAREEAEIIAATKEAPPNFGEARTKLAGRIRVLSGASDAVFASTAMCLTRELAKYMDSQEGERLAQAARFGTMILASSAQQRAGDTVAEAVGAANSDWDAVPGVTPDAAQSAMYLMLTGQQVNPTNPDFVTQMAGVPQLSYDELVIEMGSNLINYIDGGLIGLVTGSVTDFQRGAVDEVCGALLNPVTQYGIAITEIGVSIATLGTVKGATAGAKVAGEMLFHGAVGFGLAELLDTLILKAVLALSNSDFYLEQGAARVGAGYVAINQLAQNSNRNVTMGAPMTTEDARTMDKFAMDQLRQENQQSSFSNRYFAIDNPFSLLGRVVAKLPASTGGLASTVRNAASFIGSILTSPFRLAGSLSNSGLFGSASAANTLVYDDNFGVDQWGWTAEELARIEENRDESFSIVSLARDLEPRMGILDGLYAKCYDPNTFILQNQEPEGCTREILTTDDALRWRYYKALMFAAEHLTGSV